MSRNTLPIPDEPISKGRMLRGVGMFVVLTVAGLAALYHLNAKSDPRRVIESLSGTFLVLAALSAVADTLIGAVRYQIFLRRILPRASLTLPIRADLANRFMGAVTPSQTGGGPAQVFILWRGGVPVGDALSFLLINFISTLVFFLSAGGFTAWIFRERFPEGAIHALVQYGFVIFATCLIAMLVGLFRPDWIAGPMARLAARLEGKTGTVNRLTHRCAASLAASLDRYRAACTLFIRENPLLPFLSFVLTLVLYLNKFTLAWLIMRGLGVDGDYVTTLAVQALLHFILFVAPSPGGSGIAELSTGALMSIVMPGHLLAPFTLAYRFFLQYLPASVGALVMLREMRPAAARPRAASVARARGARAVAGGAVAVALALAMPAIRAGAAAIDPARDVPDRVLGEAASYAAVQEVLVEGLLASDRETAHAFFAESVERARALVEDAPTDPEAHYLLAVALGYSLEDEGIRSKVRIAGEVRAEAERALELDPEHAGAHHVMGRLHAGAMRLSRLSRFVAGRILGGAAMRDVSWEQAEHHFREAWHSDPSSPRHPMELGALFLDTDRPEMARPFLEDAVTLTPAAVPDSLASARARILLAELSEG